MKKWRVVFEWDGVFDEILVMADTLECAGEKSFFADSAYIEIDQNIISIRQIEFTDLDGYRKAKTMNNITNKVMGYFLANPNTTFSRMLADTHLNIHEAHEAVEWLKANGYLQGRGFASHVEEYFVPDGGKFFNLENIGRLYLAQKKSQTEVAADLMEKHGIRWIDHL